MPEYLGGTTSVCRACGRLLPANSLSRDGAVWLEKHCPAHGPQSARLNGDVAAWTGLSHFHRAASVPRRFATQYTGCPDSCGLCPEHEQHVCMPILEITGDCDLECPICLVHNGNRRHWSRDDVAHVLETLIESEGQVDVLNLSGGEPTLHPQFRQIVDDCLARREILRVSVSTNGLTLLSDPSLLQFLAERRVVISLQCDGFDDEIYRALRGRNLADEKRRLIDAAGELHAPMSLTATVVAGVNDSRLHELVEMLFTRDHILSLMLQPAAYAGRAASLHRPESAVTIPDVIGALDGAAGIVRLQDFSPLPCSHPACFSLAFYLRAEDGGFVSMKQLVNAERYLDMICNRTLPGTDESSYRCMTDAVYDLWSGPAGLLPDSRRALGAARRLLAGIEHAGYAPGRALAAAERSIKSIFIHQFMDRDSFDLSRARKCCQVYPQPDGRMIPACVHNCLGRR